jgi:hypothetical protein
VFRSRHLRIAYDAALEHEKLLRATYEAFNARDVNAVLRHLTADVDWPNAWEGGRVHGHDGVRDYWTRQWSAVDPTVKPVAFTTRPDGSIAVEVDQAARSLDGALLGEGRVLHVYIFRDDLVARMDVEELGSGVRPPLSAGGAVARSRAAPRPP